jgi:hypothetical protein
MSHSVLDNAIGYVRRSIPVLLVNDEKEPLGDLHPNGFHSALRTPEDCRRACAMHPEGKLAVVTGPASGLTVFDVDGLDGASALGELEQELGPLPPTTLVATPRPGLHHWFATGADEIGCRIGLGPRLDVKSSGGYVLAPPSVIAGRPYRFVSRHAPAPLPHPWRERLRSSPPRRSRVDAGEWLDLLASRALSEGTRNDRLTRLVGHLLAHHVNAAVVLALALAVNARCCAPPLAEAEVESIVTSIAGREARKP